MNYRHIYHAGNFADVIKHIMLMLVMDYLQQKDKPLFALDTHAGIGLYDLQSEEAMKTSEAELGIGRVWTRNDAPEAVKKYCALVQSFNKGKKGDLPHFYPGSPMIVQSLLRDQDRFVANELHPEDVKTLRMNIGESRQTKVESLDGYIQLKALLPPPERRGVVLIDPPFEVRNEFEQMIKGLENSIKRWAQGTYMFWYPIKDPKIIRDFHADLAATGIPNIIAIDFMATKPMDLTRFNGTGLVIVNPPWILVEQARTILPWLVEAMTQGRGAFKINIIAGE